MLGKGRAVDATAGEKESLVPSTHVACPRWCRFSTEFQFMSTVGTFLKRATETLTDFMDTNTPMFFLPSFAPPNNMPYCKAFPWS